MKRDVTLIGGTADQATIPVEMEQPIKLARVFATTDAEVPVRLIVVDGGDYGGFDHFVRGSLDWSGEQTIPFTEDNGGVGIKIYHAGLPTGKRLHIALEYGF